jgi:hypothetical protein
MFFRRIVTKRNGKEYTYLKLIESYRENGKVKQRVIANLGNIENLDPEKVGTLITSLNKLSDPCVNNERVKKVLPEEGYSPPQNRAVNLDKMWQKLGLSDFLCRAFNDRHSHKVALLVKAMVFQKMLFPQEPRPIAVSYRNVALPQIKNYEPTGNDFYRATASLAKIKNHLEFHLYKILSDHLNAGSLLYMAPVSGEYLGYECDLNTTGTTYQVQPHKRPVHLLVSTIPPGIPVNCRVSNRPFDSTKIIAAQEDIAGHLKAKLCIIADTQDHSGITTLPPGVPLIKSLPLEEFAVIPVSSSDLWQDRDAFTVNNTLWIKDIAKTEKRYIICHDLRPTSPSDRVLETKLAGTAQELDKIKSLVRQQRLRREKTIIKRINAILQKNGCEDYFNFRLNLKEPDIHYSRNEEVIHKLKTLNRTKVLETNIKELPALEIVESYQQWSNIKNKLQLINDPVKIPVIHPFTEENQINEYITGQAIVHLLSCTLETLISQGDDN